MYFQVLIIFSCCILLKSFQTIINKLILNPQHILYSIKLMLTKTLQQINEMSQKIQLNVKKVLLQTANPYHFSNQTHYQTHQRSSKKNKRGHQKTLSDPRPTNINTSQINKYMLEQQNELLKEEIKELKQKTNKYRIQIKDLKKYIKFLEQYNDNLKKQVVLWMTRPAKKQSIQNQIDKKAKEYRTKLNQLIRNKQIQNNYQSTNPNSINVNQSVLSQPKNKYSTSVNIRGNSCQCTDCVNQPEYQQPTSFSVKLPTPQIKYSAPIKNFQLQCTSCNYLQHQKQKNRFLDAKKSSDYYDSTNLYKKFSKDLSKNSKTAQKKTKTLKIINKPLRNPQYAQNDGNNSIDLQTYRNDGSLCSCHEQYLKNRKF